MPRGLPLLGALAFVLSAPSASAAASAHLVYARSPDADTCPDESALREAVKVRTGYVPFFPWAKRTVVATITRRGHAFVASVELVDEDGFTQGAHELKTEGACEELLDAVALSIAIAIDPRVLVAAAAPEAPPQAEPEPEPPLAPPPKLATVAPPPLPMAPVAPPVDAMPLPPEHPRAQIEGSAGVLATQGTSPSAGPTAGLSLGGDVRWRAVSIGIEGRIDAPAGENAGGGSVSSWLTAGSIVPCGYLGKFFLCGLVQVGVMEASSAGVTDHRSASLLWLAAGGRAGVLFPVGGKLLLRFHGDLVADLAPATLELNGTGAWTSSTVAGSLGADVVVRFR